MDKNKLFVAGFPWAYTNDTLRNLFSQYGQITDVAVISDRATGRSKGFGFVTFANEADARKAMEALNGTDLEGRKLVVNIARPKTDTSQ